MAVAVKRTFQPSAEKPVWILARLERAWSNCEVADWRDREEREFCEGLRATGASLLWAGEAEHNDVRMKSIEIERKHGMVSLEMCMLFSKLLCHSTSLLERTNFDCGDSFRMPVRIWEHIWVSFGRKNENRDAMSIACRKLVVTGRAINRLFAKCLSGWMRH